MPKAWNWRLWVGFVISLLAPYTYFSLFEATRFALWISLLLLIIAIWLLMGGLRRAYAAPESYRGRMAGTILTTLSVVVMALFGFALYEMKRAYAVAPNAPQVGQKAPEFALIDSNSRPVNFRELLAAPLPSASGVPRAPRGALIVFYRGYW